MDTKKIAHWFKTTALFRLASIRRWSLLGCPIPPPHAVKQAALLWAQWQTGARVFIETGTRYGYMVAAMARYFDALYSIELDSRLYSSCVKRFAGVPNVHLIEGDSSEQLPLVLEGIERECVLWLDGHYSGRDTALGAEVTPIVEELEAIARHPVKNHAIVIDDARLFDDAIDYPSTESLQVHTMRLFPRHRFVRMFDEFLLVPIEPTRGGRLPRWAQNAVTNWTHHVARLRTKEQNVFLRD